MTKKGKSLERLIATLEKTLSNENHVKIESPKRRRDKVTGKLREHDVVLTVTQGHHSLLIAIECRDRSRPVTDEQIGAFFRKCHDTGVDQGVMVSSNGFYNTARTKAEHLGIRCLDIEEVESFSWLLTPAFHVIKPQLLHTDWIFYPKFENESNIGDFEILDANGAIVSTAVFTSNAQQQLNRLLPEKPEPVEAGELRVAGDMKMSLPTIKDDTMGSDNEYQQGGLRPSHGAGLALPASRCPASYRGRPSSCWSALLPTGYRTFCPPASVAVAQRHVLCHE